MFSQSNAQSDTTQHHCYVIEVYDTADDAQLLKIKHLHVNVLCTNVQD